MKEYWVVGFSSRRWDEPPLVAGPWYGRRGRKEARARLRQVLTDSHWARHPCTFLVRTVGYPGG